MSIKLFALYNVTKSCFLRFTSEVIEFSDHNAQHYMFETDECYPVWTTTNKAIAECCKERSYGEIESNMEKLENPYVGDELVVIEFSSGS